MKPSANFLIHSMNLHLNCENSNPLSIHRFLESMKLPTSTKPTSGFHICDILELNKDKQKKQESNRDDDQRSRIDDDELKAENLSCESEENLVKNETSIKRKHSPSPPTSPTESQTRLENPQETKDLKKIKKHLKQIDMSSGPHQLLSETIYQYPHLFQNHPAMRPWFNPTGKLHSNTRIISVIKMES